MRLTMGGTYCGKACVYHSGACRVVRLRTAQLVPNYACGLVPGDLLMPAEGTLLVFYRHAGQERPAVGASYLRSTPQTRPGQPASVQHRSRGAPGEDR